jgi:hypothetical protein
MITIQELLFNRKLDKSAKIKLVRHKQVGRDLYNLYLTGAQEIAGLYDISASIFC